MPNKLEKQKYVGALSFYKTAYALGSILNVYVEWAAGRPGLPFTLIAWRPVEVFFAAGGAVGRSGNRNPVQVRIQQPIRVLCLDYCPKSKHRGQANRNCCFLISGRSCRSGLPGQ